MLADPRSRRQKKDGLNVRRGNHPKNHLEGIHEKENLSEVHRVLDPLRGLKTRYKGQNKNI